MKPESTRQHSAQSTKKKNAGGRPPKFPELRRPVTVTLPERILQKLEVVNRDRSRAIVKCVEAVAGEGDRPLKSVELIEVAPGKALIVMRPSKSLSQIKWLRLVEIAPARYLLALPSGTHVEVLEVAIHDLLDDLDPGSDERTLLTELQKIIGYQRRRRSLSKAELLFVDIPGGS
jgi:hypothetical protein